MYARKQRLELCVLCGCDWSCLQRYFFYVLYSTGQHFWRNSVMSFKYISFVGKERKAFVITDRFDTLILYKMKFKKKVRRVAILFGTGGQGGCTVTKLCDEFQIYFFSWLCVFQTNKKRSFTLCFLLAASIFLFLFLGFAGYIFHPNFHPTIFSLAELLQVDISVIKSSCTWGQPKQSCTHGTPTIVL